MRQVIIDGYNVIHTDDVLLRLYRQNRAAARDGLLTRLRSAACLRTDQVTVVFDGWQNGAPQQSRERVQGIIVIYSRLGERADDVIKRLVTEARARAGSGPVVVVSNDSELRGHGVMEGVETSTSPNLLGQLTPARHRQRPSGPYQRGTCDDDSDEQATHNPFGPKKGPARRTPKRGRTDRSYQF